MAEESLDTWVSRILASNTTRLDHSGRDLVDEPKILTRGQVEQDALHLIRANLSDESKGLWKISLDNADDVGFLLESPEQTGEGPGKHEAQKSVYETDTGDVLSMKVEEAAALLRRKLGQE